MKTFQVSCNDGVLLDDAIPLVRVTVRVACLALLIVLSRTVAFADPVRTVTGGVIWTGNYDTGFNLSGPDFTFDVSQWLDPIANCAPCIPGTAWAPSAVLTVRDWDAGRATFDGRTYDTVYFSGSFDIHADPLIVPDMPPGQSGPDAQGLTRIWTTFTATGTLAGYADSSLTGPPLFSTGLIGGGTARVAFSNYPPESGIRVLQLDYSLNEAAMPTPEPGSMLLFGSGAAWIVTRWRKRATSIRAAETSRVKVADGTPTRVERSRLD